MAVSKRLRFEVLRRDGHRCRYCGATPQDQELRVDHVVPIALGGTDDPSNLVTACEPCNTGKSSIAPDSEIVAAVSDDALRWAAALKVAASIRLDECHARADRHEEFLANWNAWTTGSSRSSRTFPLPGDWPGSIDQFVAAGLELFDLKELTDIAMCSHADDKWRYFCGCAWRRIEEAHKVAREILDSPKVATEGSDGG